MRWVLHNIEDISGVTIAILTINFTFSEVALRFGLSLFNGVVTAYVVHLLKKKYWEKK